MTSNSSTKPFMLVIDDEPDMLRTALATQWPDRMDLEVLHPAEVEHPHLARADLVLVDYKLEHWHERDSVDAVCCRPENGLALAALLREHVDRSSVDRLTSFALHTAHLRQAQGRLSLAEASARHVVARSNNLEWVFPKTDDSRYKQMALLADATRQLPSAWPTDRDESAALARRLLNLDDAASWSDRCWRDVRECQPPIHELAQGGHGVLILRWLLQQIIPYPCFLWDARWVAARLHVTVDVLHRVLAGSSALATDLIPLRYSGILNDFLGTRWWRGALEDYVWELCDGDLGRLRAKLNERAGVELEVLEMDQPVVCLGPDLQPTERFVSAKDAVNLRPDQWPAFADAAWMDIATVRDDPDLRAMVDPLDEYRVTGGEDT